MYILCFDLYITFAHYICDVYITCTLLVYYMFAAKSKENCLQELYYKELRFYRSTYKQTL